MGRISHTKSIIDCRLAKGCRVLPADAGCRQNDVKNPDHEDWSIIFEGGSDGQIQNPPHSLDILDFLKYQGRISSTKTKTIGHHGFYALG